MGYMGYTFSNGCFFSIVMLVFRGVNLFFAQPSPCHSLLMYLITIRTAQQINVQLKVTDTKFNATDLVVFVTRIP